MWYQSKDVGVLNFDAPSCHISSHLPCQIPECNLSSFQETLGIFVEPGCERLCGSVQQRLGSHGLQWFYRVFGKNWAIHWPGSHLLAIWWFLWKKPPRSKMVRHPQTNLGRWVAQKKSRTTVPNLLFESFWIVSKVSKEEVFMKTGVDLTKTAFSQRENIRHFQSFPQFCLIHQNRDFLFALRRVWWNLFGWPWKGGAPCIHQRSERGDLPWIIWGFYLNFIQQGVLLAGTKGSFCHCGHGMLIVIGSLDKFFSENANHQVCYHSQSEVQWQAPIRGKKLSFRQYCTNLELM